MLTRRQIILTAPLLLSACAADSESYDATVARTWNLGPLMGLDGSALQHELVRYATLVPSSHNTQRRNFSPSHSRACVGVIDNGRQCSHFLQHESRRGCSRSDPLLGIGIR